MIKVFMSDNEIASYSGANNAEVVGDGVLVVQRITELSPQERMRSSTPRTPSPRTRTESLGVHAAGTWRYARFGEEQEDSLAE